MKNLFSVIIALCIAGSMQAQTLFTYGNSQVSKDEFLHAFNKNNTNTSNSEKAYRDYLELYIRFRLKVKAAYDARLDTLPTQKTELQNFRGQIIDGFMNDESSIRQLVDEAFARSQKDLHVSHILIPYTGADTMAAFTKITEAWNKLRAGADFSTTALAYSGDPSVASNKGNLGYITVFTLPYEFESLAYSTPAGKFSAPYRSSFAYHIFKVVSERPAIGRMKAAQILVGFTPNDDDAAKEKKRVLADSIYTALLKGASFKDLVSKYSTDNISYQSGGLLPEFGAGRYSEDFETAAFALKKDGDISKPLLTSFGYHIIQRVESVPVNTDPHNEAAIATLKQQVQADKRISVAKDIMAKKILKLTGYAPASFNSSLFAGYADSLFAGRKPKQLPLMNDKTVLFSFPQQKVTAGDFARYYNSIRNNLSLLRGKSLNQLLMQHAETVGNEYYRNRLEHYNKEFAGQLREFKDGNLLFEIMQRQVWDKAAADSTGLNAYYNAHKEKYWWEASADVILFTCSDSSSAEKAKAAFSESHDWKSIVQNSDGTVQADSGRFELTQIPGLTASSAAGTLTAPTKSSTDNITSFAFVVKTYPAHLPRSFEDARGFVINDYQIFLEDKWVEALKKKYPVKVNEQVLRSCWQ